MTQVKPDLAVTDTILGLFPSVQLGMSGNEIAQMVKRQDPSTPVIMRSIDLNKREIKSYGSYEGAVKDVVGETCADRVLAKEDEVGLEAAVRQLLKDKGFTLSPAVQPVPPR